MTPRATHVLLFEGLPVARVWQEDCELVTVTGRYRLEPDARDRPELTGALAWHDRAVEAAGRQAAGSALARAAAPGVDGRWSLRDRSGSEAAIGAPTFLTGGKLAWHWVGPPPAPGDSSGSTAPDLRSTGGGSDPEP